MLPPPHLPKRGAPFRNRNRLVHGRYTREMAALRKEVRDLLAGTKALLRATDELPKPERTV